MDFVGPKLIQKHQAYLQLQVATENIGGLDIGMIQELSKTDSKGSVQSLSLQLSHFPELNLLV
jgi:hypothetical protein